MLAPDGVTTRAASSYNQQVGFTGRYLDKETGLHYYRTRYYSGNLGRFISRDFARSGFDKWRISFTPQPTDGYRDGCSLYAGYFIPNRLDPYGEGWLEAFVQGVTQASLAVGTAFVVGLAVGTPVGWVALATIGTIAAVTGAISGAQTDGVGTAMFNGAVNGVIQGAGAGGGVVLSELHAALKITTTQLIVGNIGLNIVTANISVVASGQTGNLKVHLGATIIGTAVGFLGGMGAAAEGGGNPVNEQLVPALFNLNGELWASALCEAHK